MDPIKFKVALKTLLLEGNLAWEYNPFRNYRLDLDMLYYKDKFWTYKEFYDEFAYSIMSLYEPSSIKVESEEDAKSYFDNFFKGNKDWYDLGIPKTETPPVPYQKGSLVDFVTDELLFDLNHPVQILPSYSYDDSVDLIINDGKSAPKIINSRFSPIGKNKYLIVDRNGDNDTNIYDKGIQFDIDSSLYKLTTTIPNISFGGTSYGGNLKIGNYFFYFKYADADGNESDWIGESGLVSIFIGNTPDSIHSGFEGLNSHKKIKFLIENTDPAYLDLIIYYCRSTSSVDLSRVTEAFKINQKFKIKQSAINSVIITGLENTVPIDIRELNMRYLIYDRAETQAVCLNMLFLGNVLSEEKDFNELALCALYIYPTIDNSVKCSIKNFNERYVGDINNTYYNPDFIYNHVGYWDDEIYRFGVVFIKSNNTLSPVYNIRGLHLGSNLNTPSFNGENLEKVIYDNYSFEIDSKCKISTENKSYENSKGVCYFPKQDSDTVIGIKFNVPDFIVKELKKYGIKGLFYVRQKRIPTTLCLAYTIGIESKSRTPVIPIPDNEFISESFLTKDKQNYIYYDDGSKETGDGYILTHSFSEHIRKILSASVRKLGAICPDYDVNFPYLNNLFTGGSFKVRLENNTEYALKTNIERLYKVNTSYKSNEGSTDYKEVKILGIEDNVKLASIGDSLFSARAGEAEEAHRFEWLEIENKQESGGNKIIRGAFGPYLGIVGLNSVGNLITIKIPGYEEANLLEYFKIRYNDGSEFFAISNRLSFDSNDFLEKLNSYTCYRGDCYICNFTHRMNRNFIDPSTPTNDDIVDPNCWDRGISYTDGVLKTEDLALINLGDVNAVRLGHWITITLRSNINHSVRGLDESHVDERVLMGKPRGFYPYHYCNSSAAYKIPDSGVYNKGFEKGVGELFHATLPDAPFYKNQYSTRIAYSNIRTNSFFENSFRVFKGGHYRDYPMTYGSITKIIELNGSLICILEHGIYKIPVNERAVAAEGGGGLAYINTSNVLPENPAVISDTFGSLWKDSIIKTPMGIYGVDTVGKKIWYISNTGSFKCISDFSIQEFLNNNISLTERELTPIIGIRNVKTHYDNFKHDVIFTFYDDQYTFEEKVWSICWNEILSKWITFYSWVPSFSENIYNLFFSFDRDTSKYIAKLGMSGNSDWADGFYISNVIMSEDSNIIGTLKPRNTKREGNDITETYSFEIKPDVWGNESKFTLNNNTLSYKVDYSDLAYTLNDITEISLGDNLYEWDVSSLVWKQGNNEIEDQSTINKLNIKRKELWKKDIMDKDLVYYLNIRMSTTLEYNGTDATYEEYISNNSSKRSLDGGYLDYTIAVIPKEHLDALSTDFWRHGQSGIIDITEDIKPTKWYGKLHPFEFEFIVNDNPSLHKIFDNLQIISNSVEPESFHYEIVGDCFDFKDDKKNMYYRQEATKKLLQENGINLTYDHEYENRVTPIQCTKSTFPQLYYARRKSINLVEDLYHNKEGVDTKNFSALAGTEIVYYKTLNEFRLWNHAKAVDITKEGRIRGNMQYKEDIWDVQINPMNIRFENESKWEEPPVVINLNSIPKDLIKKGEMNIPEGILNVSVNISDNKNKEIKMKDKYIKIRIRYSGNDLAVISAVKTLYSISFA